MSAALGRSTWCHCQPSVSATPLSPNASAIDCWNEGPSRQPSNRKSMDQDRVGIEEDSCQGDRHRLQREEIQRGVPDEAGDCDCCGREAPGRPRLATEEISTSPALERESSEDEERCQAEAPGDQGRDSDTSSIGKFRQGRQSAEAQCRNEHGSRAERIDPVGAENSWCSGVRCLHRASRRILAEMRWRRQVSECCQGRKRAARASESWCAGCAGSTARPRIVESERVG